MIRNSKAPRVSLKMSAIIGLLCSAAALSSCARDPVTTASIPMDYRERHPITLSESQHSLDIPIAMGDHRLPANVADNIKGFVQDYKNASSGIIQIQLPRGSHNAGAASAMRKQIRQVMTTAGVEAGKIVETSYQANEDYDAAPIRLSYIAMTAMTGQCGQWPEDLTNDTGSNRNWYNFGCASQNNLAAQIANPMDLMGPRGMSPIDAERRNAVIETYRSGDKPLN
jgi:pilus assembly protein CpaD